jgi:predicted nucleotidyltransferase
VKDNNIIKSFFSKDELNSKIWDENQHLRKDVREKLLKTANEFIDFIGVPLLIEDVIFTGSLANYNWSEYSDIDLHVVCDFIQFSDTELSLYEELFKVKKTIFNTNHDIKIFGYEVELYVQNATEAHFSSGVYSVLYDDWDVKPEKEDSNIDTKILKSKINHWKAQIDTVVDNATEKDIDEAREYIKKFKEKLKKYRSSGLKKEGEYSYENLVFKYLRRSDYLEKLFNLENNLLDKELSLTEQKLDFLLNLKKS